MIYSDMFYKFNLFLADVMVLNDIIEQAAGHQSQASDHGGKSAVRA